MNMGQGLLLRGQILQDQSIFENSLVGQVERVDRPFDRVKLIWGYYKP